MKIWERYSREMDRGGEAPWGHTHTDQEPAKAGLTREALAVWLRKYRTGGLWGYHTSVVSPGKSWRWQTNRDTSASNSSWTLRLVEDDYHE